MIATFQEPSYIIEEGILGQVCGELSSMAAIPVTVTLSIMSGSALESVDFTIPSPSITFQAGSVLSCTDVMITDDSLLEDSEFFTLALNSSNPFVQTSGTATVTIPNRSSKQSSLLYHFMMIFPLFCFYTAVTVSFLQPTQSIPESSSVQICSQLSGEAAIPVTVPLVVVGGGTAVQNTDFILSSQSVTFPTGAVESCVSVSAVDDSILEEDEMFSLALQSSETVLTGTGSTAAVTIIDQDSMLTESLNSSVIKLYF